MKIAIPAKGNNGLDSKVSIHFGRCSHFIIIDESGQLTGSLENTSRHMGGTKLPPELLKAKGIQILLCNELGRKAVALCENIGIDVLIGQGNTVKEIFEEWKNGETKKANIQNSCIGH